MNPGRVPAYGGGKGNLQTTVPNEKSKRKKRKPEEKPINDSTSEAQPSPANSKTGWGVGENKRRGGSKVKKNSWSL